MKPLALAFALGLSLLRVGANEPPFPVARIIDELPIPSRLFFPPDPERSHIVIAPDVGPTLVTVDASATFDPDGDVLVYTLSYWDEGRLHPFAGESTNAVFSFYDSASFSQDFDNSILLVFDGEHLATLPFNVFMIDLKTAVWYLKDDLGEFNELPVPDISFRYARGLNATLDRAMARLDKGRKGGAIRAIRHFETLIRLQRGHLGEELTHRFLDYTDILIKAIRASRDRP